MPPGMDARDLADNLASRSRGSAFLALARCRFAGQNWAGLEVAGRSRR